MSDEEPCGDCLACTTRLISSLIGEDMREFLSVMTIAAVDASTLRGNTHPESREDIIGFMSGCLAFLGIINPDSFDGVAANLVAAGFIIIEED